MVPSHVSWGAERISSDDSGANQTVTTSEEVAASISAATAETTYRVNAGVTSEGSITVSAGAATGTSLDAVAPGDQVTITATPEEGYYLSQVRMSKNAVSGNDDSAVYEALTAGADGTYSFTMPEQDVQVYADFVSIVWDGTMDVTWYNATDTSFTIKYAAQMAGLSAIVNGIFNNYPTSANDDGIQICDYGKYLKQMGVKWEDASGNVVTEYSATDDSSVELGSALYGEFTSTNTVFDTQGQTASSALSVDIAHTTTTTQRVVGNADWVKANLGNGTPREGSQNLVTTQSYFYGIDNFSNKTVNIVADLDFGGRKTQEGKWDSSSPLYMPVGGQCIILPLVIWGQNEEGEYVIQSSNGYNHIGSSFCGTLDGHGHSLSNVYCERYGYGANFGDSQSVGIVGRLGIHDNDYSGQGVQPPVNPTVRNIVVASGYISSRRSVGGIVGKIGHTSRTDLQDGSTGGIIEYCINKADTFNTDAKGVAGICGASFNGGVIRYCANFGTVTSTYSDPEGGIVGYNENDIINCYNVGKVVNTHEYNARFAMGIASHNGGDYKIENDYWLLGSAMNDYLSDGYHWGGFYGIDKGTTQGQSNNGTWSFGDAITTYDGTVTYSADYPTLTAAMLNNGDAEIWKDATSGVNDGYPELYYQAKDYQESACQVTVQQPDAGGTISVSTTTGSYGSSVTISSQCESGYVVTGYYVDGQPLSGNSFILTKDVTVTATMGQLKTYAFHYDNPDTDAYTFSATKDGTVIENGQAVQKTDVPISEGDIIYQNDVIKVNLILKEGAVPADTAKEYTGQYVLKLAYGDASGTAKSKTFYSSNNTLSYTVAGTEDAETGFTLSFTSLTSADKSWTTQADTSWYNPDDPQASYVINTPQQLAGLNALIGQKVTFEGVTIALGQDISLANFDGTDATRYWKVQTSTSYPFKGTFDGAGHVISGMAAKSGVNTVASYSGLFGLAVGATIKNLTVAGTSESSSYAGGIVGYAENVQMENVSSQVDVTCSKTSGRAGGIAAQLKIGTLTNCTNTGSVTNSVTTVSTNNATGGLCGYVQSTVFTKCINQGTVTAPASYVGGLAGYASAYSYDTYGGTDFVQCANFGSVCAKVEKSAKVYLGGLSGYAAYSTISESFNAGSVSAEGSSVSGNLSVAGLIALAESASSSDFVFKVSDSFNAGAVSATSESTSADLYVSGMVGLATSANLSFSNCYNAGSAAASGGKSQTAAQYVGKCTGTGATCAISNSYYLENGATSAFDADATAQSSDQLKADAAVLGDKFCDSTAVVQKAYPALSEGYPALKWLAEDAKIDWGDWTVTKAATCTESGEEQRTCITNPSYVETRTIPALGHDFGEYASDGNATCTADGTKSAKCARCDATDVVADEGSALGHDFGEYASDGNATCTADGTKSAKCSRCDAADTVADEGSALGHDFGEYASDGNATCTADGTKSAKCSRCDATDTVADEGSALGHDWGAWTDNGDGTESRLCKRDGCGATETRVADALVSFAERLYTEVLDREPDAEGLAHQVAALRAGAYPADIVYNYFNSAEYAGKGETADQTVERVYRVMFGRDSDAAGKAMWVGYLEDGMSVRAVVAGFSQADEYKSYFGRLGVDASTVGVSEARDRNRNVTAFCSRLYTCCLGRDYDVDGLNVQVGAILAGMSASQIACNFFTSSEFLGLGLDSDEAVERCYGTMMGRASDAGGKAFWLERMATWTASQGRTAALSNLVAGFAQSDEWRKICSEYGVRV